MTKNIITLLILILLLAGVSLVARQNPINTEAVRGKALALKTSTTKFTENIKPRAGVLLSSAGESLRNAGENINQNLKAAVLTIKGNMEHTGAVLASKLQVNTSAFTSFNSIFERKESQPRGVYDFDKLDPYTTRRFLGIAILLATLGVLLLNHERLTALVSRRQAIKPANIKRKRYANE